MRLEVGERGRENLSLDEGETVTARTVEDVARPITGAYFSKCVLQFTQILFSILCIAVYNDATNNKNTINRSHYPLKQNTYLSLGTPGFASVHEPDPDAIFAPGAAKRNPVGLRTETRAEKYSTVAMENFGLLIAVSFGAEVNS